MCLSEWAPYVNIGRLGEANFAFLCPVNKTEDPAIIRRKRSLRDLKLRIISLARVRELCDQSVATSSVLLYCENGARDKQEPDWTGDRTQRQVGRVRIETKYQVHTRNKKICRQRIMHSPTNFTSGNRTEYELLENSTKN